MCAHRLYSPADAHRMYLQGNVVKVHPNGRINYEGRETLADGADPLAESAARAAALVDRAALKAEVRGLGNIRAVGIARTVESVREEFSSAGRTSPRKYSDNREQDSTVEEAQAAVDRGEEGAAERLERAEEELERALEAVLDAECADGAGFGGKSYI
ncbi:unnamed protein product [Sphacelaria rigidula]